MLAKAIATNFNSPVRDDAGLGLRRRRSSGLDVIIVRFLVRKAKKLARKWGGQCIIFIDEIDAVGMRRQALGAGIGHDRRSRAAARSTTSLLRADGLDAPDGELLLETRAWRERLFAERAARSARRHDAADVPARSTQFIVSPAAWAGWAAAWRSTSC